MAKGGKRPGAGRPKGEQPCNKERRNIAIIAAVRGISPLEVMIEAMRHHYEAGELDEAAAIAKDAAPYVHPRLTAIQHSGDPDNPMQVIHTFEQLKRLPFDELRRLHSETIRLPGSLRIGLQDEETNPDKLSG